MAIDIHAGIAGIESFYGQNVIAVALNPDGTVYDHTFNWETAQNMALQGTKIVAVADDGSMSKDDIQALCDAERERFNDCFGIEN